MMFLLRVFVLLVILLSAAAGYDIRDCDPKQTTWVERALGETILLAGLAGRTIREALDTQTGIPPQVKRILDPFLPNSDEAADEAAYGALWKKYTTIENRLETSNIRYYCKDPGYRTPEGNSFYPIDMTRVNGQPQGDYDHCGNNYLGGNYYMHVSGPNPADLAYTVTSTPGSPTFREQFICTGSNKEWSDIVMLRILREVEEGWPVTFSDFPESIGAMDWTQVRDPLTAAGPVLTVALFHAIVHSVAVQDPNPRHSQTASWENANSLSEVLSGYFIPSVLPPEENPSTIVWVAFILGMVGYYLNEAAILEQNTFEGKIWFPGWALATDGDPITSENHIATEIYYDIMRNGPFNRVLGDLQDDCIIDCD
ncbi:hypothetical protein V8E54_002064 [Elaphomyces granulatus]